MTAVTPSLMPADHLPVRTSGGRSSLSWRADRWARTKLLAAVTAAAVVAAVVGGLGISGTSTAADADAFSSTSVLGAMEAARGGALLGEPQVVTAGSFSSVAPQGAREDFLVVKGYREQFDAAILSSSETSR
jgi:hypothetical protein